MRSPNRFDLKCCERRVDRDEWHPLELRLRGQHAVEWVAVCGRITTSRIGMGERQR
jgi:hypothetical protein